MTDASMETETAIETGPETGRETGAQPRAKAETNAAMSPQALEKIDQLRTHLHQSFGQVVMAMMGLPRYRHQNLGDLTHLLLEPLMRDRIAMAKTRKGDAASEDLAGLAIWASVSEEVDAKIREQIKAGVFPVRLTADDWNSGKINWLLDIIAPDGKTAGSVLANFKQVAKDGELRLHPLIASLVDKATLDQLVKTQAGKTT